VGHKVWFIDVIGNKTSIDKKHVLLSSVLWNFAPIFKRAVHDIEDGTYGTHLYSLNDSTGISLLKTRYIKPALWNLIERDRKLIAAGKIHVPLTPNESAVRRILKGS
jgi:simple sugar transport system substrate-binding protein